MKKSTLIWLKRLRTLSLIVASILLLVGVVDLIADWMGFWEESLLPWYFQLVLWLFVFLYAGFDRAVRER